MIKYHYILTDLPNESRSSWKAKSKPRRQGSRKLKTSKGKATAKDITPPTSEEEPDEEDNQGSLKDNGEISGHIQLVGWEVIGKNVTQLSQRGKVAEIILQVSDDEPASDYNSMTGQLTHSIQAPVKLLTSKGKRKDKAVALPTSAEEPVSAELMSIDIQGERGKARQSLRNHHRKGSMVQMPGNHWLVMAIGQVLST
jgi:hypothetical protein